MNKLFDAFIYINCKHRIDRNDHMIKQLKNLNFDMNKVHRLEATHIPLNGAKGCSHSHYRVMDMAIKNNWNNIFIMEDDFAFDNFILSVKKIKYVIENYPNWDVIMPFFFLNGLEKRSRKIDNFIRIPTHKKYRAFSTLCYAVNKKMFTILKDNFYESYKIQPPNKINENKKNKFPVDKYWQRLQLSYEWYLITPKCGYQIETKSDISI
jgi:GR25 family glycosyltransferase involved in LPS biosynthesis